MYSRSYKLQSKSKAVFAAVGMLASAAVLNDVGNGYETSSTSKNLHALSGGLLGMSEGHQGDVILERMLSIREEDIKVTDTKDGRLLISAKALQDGYYASQGAGICLDPEGYSYDHVTNTKSSAAKCAQFCARSILYIEHRGFHWNSATNACQCLFDDHKIPRPLQKKSEEVTIQPNGYGAVAGVDATGDNAAFECYKKDLAALPTPLDSYSSKACDVDDGMILDTIVFEAYTAEKCASLCGRFHMLETHMGFTVTQEGQCRCLFKEGEMPTTRKMSNSGAVLEGGISFADRFGAFVTPANVLCYDRIDTMGSEPPANQLAATGSNVFINEFHFRNYGVNEPFVRVVGPKDADASNYKIISYLGRDGTIHSTATLSGTFASSDNHPTFGSVKLDLVSTALRKGKQGGDGLALVDTSTGTCLQFISYASEATYSRSFKAMEGECNGEASVPIGVTEVRDIPVGNSLQLSGSGSTYSDFSWTGPAAEATGTANDGQTLV